MSDENLFQKNEINQCSSCASWKVDHAKSENRALNVSNLIQRIGLCIGGGFDGLYTQSDETCSMWNSLIDKHKVMPIFYPKRPDENR
jgi:hypothetical protein